MFALLETNSAADNKARNPWNVQAASMPDSEGDIRGRPLERPDRRSHVADFQTGED